MPNVLTSEELEIFATHGVLHLPQAIPRDVTSAMVDRIWEWIEQTHGSRRDDPSTWTTGRYKWNPLTDIARRLRAKTLRSDRLTGAITDITGHDRWRYPASVGTLLVDPPDADPYPWRVSGRDWHWDGTWSGPWVPGEGVMFFTLLEACERRGGGTLLLEGSRGFLDEVLAATPPDEVTKKRKQMNARFAASHPYLQSLRSGRGAVEDPTGFLEPFVDEEGRRFRVVEVLGEPGDVVLCQPLIWHCRPPVHSAATPRFIALRWTDQT